MGWPIQENGFLPHVEYTVIFSFGCKSYKQSGYEGPSPTATPIKFQIRCKSLIINENMMMHRASKPRLDN